jgi:hypothetical protein
VTLFKISEGPLSLSLSSPHFLSELGPRFARCGAHGNQCPGEIRNPHGFTVAANAGAVRHAISRNLAEFGRVSWRDARADCVSMTVHRGLPLIKFFFFFCASSSHSVWHVESLFALIVMPYPLKQPLSDHLGRPFVERLVRCTKVR